VITIAGYGTTYLVENGASVTFIAGEKILFLPGAKVLSGGYLHGYITSDGQYCNNPDMPMVSNPVEIEKEVVSGQPEHTGTMARIYPNPASLSFTAELSDMNGGGMTTIEILTTGGVPARFIRLNGDRKTIVTIDDLMPGLYFVRITTDKGTETCKVVKM
jgi:hypothetical protein